MRNRELKSEFLKALIECEGYDPMKNEEIPLDVLSEECREYVENIQKFIREVAVADSEVHWAFDRRIRVGYDKNYYEYKFPNTVSVGFDFSDVNINISYEGAQIFYKSYDDMVFTTRKIPGNEWRSLWEAYWWHEYRAELAIDKFAVGVRRCFSLISGPGPVNIDFKDEEVLYPIFFKMSYGEFRHELVDLIRRRIRNNVGKKIFLKNYSAEGMSGEKFAIVLRGGGSEHYLLTDRYFERYSYGELIEDLAKEIVRGVKKYFSVSHQVNADSEVNIDLIQTKKGNPAFNAMLAKILKKKYGIRARGHIPNGRRPLKGRIFFEVDGKDYFLVTGKYFEQYKQGVPIRLA